ncbi:hypothetical protein ABIA03_004232 [Bradyrhizobium yuanmingense]
MTVAVAAPLNGDTVRIAAITTGSRAEPSAVAKKFRIERRASPLCASTSAHDVAATKSASVLLTLGIGSCGTRGVFLVFRTLCRSAANCRPQMLCLTACLTIITIQTLARGPAAAMTAAVQNGRRTYNDKIKTAHPAGARYRE